MWISFINKRFGMLVAISLVMVGCASKPVAPESASESKYAAQKEGGAAAASDAEHIPPVPHDPAVEKVARQAMPLYAQGLQLKAQGKLEQALKVFRDVSSQYPVLSGPLVNQGLILLAQEEYEDAEKVLEKAIKTNNQNPYAYNALGLTQRELGKFSEAKENYMKALSLDSKYARAHFNLGVLAELYLQDLPLALVHFRAYQSLQRTEDENVGNWIVDLERRVPDSALPSETTSQAGISETDNDTENTP